MKILKTVLFSAMMCLCGQAMAQKILQSDMTVTKPLSMLRLGDSNFKLDPAKDKFTLRFNIFENRYITYELELSGENVSKGTQEVLGVDGKLHMTWTGDTKTFINAAEDKNNGQPMYYVLTASKSLDGIVGYTTEGGWMVVFTDRISKNCITDIYPGVSYDVVLAGLKKGGGSAITMKQTGKEGNLTIYTAYGARLQDDAYRSDLTHVKTDDPYGRFYFNANNKLVKWYLMK